MSPADYFALFSMYCLNGLPSNYIVRQDGVNRTAGPDLYSVVDVQSIVNAGADEGVPYLSRWYNQCDGEGSDRLTFIFDGSWPILGIYNPLDVSGGGIAAINGQWSRPASDLNNPADRPAYTISATAPGPYGIIWDGSNWLLTDSDDVTLYHKSSSGYPLGTFTADAGTPPAPDVAMSYADGDNRALLRMAQYGGAYAQHDTPNADQVTVQFKARVRNSVEYKPILKTSGGDNNLLYIYFRNNRLYVTHKNHDGTLTQLRNVIISANNWGVYTVVIDRQAAAADQTKIYVNGTETPGTLTTGDDVSGSFLEYTDTYFLSDLDLTRYFEGEITDLWIASGVLSEAKRAAGEERLAWQWPQVTLSGG